MSSKPKPGTGVPDGWGGNPMIELLGIRFPGLAEVARECIVWHL